MRLARTPATTITQLMVISLKRSSSIAELKCNIDRDPRPGNVKCRRHVPWGPVKSAILGDLFTVFPRDRQFSLSPNRPLERETQEKIPRRDKIPVSPETVTFPLRSSTKRNPQTRSLKLMRMRRPQSHLTDSGREFGGS